MSYSNVGFRTTSRAAMAGFTHTTAHDLRRTTAAAMHNARTPDGGHVYSLVDIQHMLDHASPEITARCYIGPSSDDVKRSAGQLLD